MKKISIALLAIIAIVAIIVACKKTPEVNLKYVDVERDLITVGATTATIQCDYQYIAILKKALFYYGEGKDAIDMNTAEMRVVQNTLYVDLMGLKANTTYKYYYEFFNGFNSMLSEASTFKTESSGVTITLPIVVTAEVIEITTVSALSGGEVTTDGGAEVTERGICWSANDNPTINDNHAAAGTGMGVFTVMMNGLEANTTYHVRAYATNEKGTAYGLDKEFKTLDGGGSANLPSVTTNQVSGVTANSAQCSGEVTSDGGAEVTERGFCWGTNENPNLSDNHIAVGAGTGTFNYSINGLTANTTYHVRAYATNSVGTAYGLDRTFTTLSGGGGGGGDVPPGAINGEFSLCDGTRVYFSKGNLQYQASTNTWQFAANQYDYIGSANSNISSTYDGWIDLFGWGTSGWNNGNAYYHPYDWDFDPYLYCYGYGPTDGTYNVFDLTGVYANADWGVYNAIANGGNMPNQWRTLTESEWRCLFFNRTTETGIRFAMAKVNDVNGVILLPDNWDPSIYALNYTNYDSAPCEVNIITVADWEVMESYGAVFLPAAGCRERTSVINLHNWAYYWSSSTVPIFSGSDACCVVFSSSGIAATDIHQFRPYGSSVRLVRIAE